MTDPMQAIEAAVASVTDPHDAAQIAAALRSVSPALVDDVVFGVASSTEGSTADGTLLGVGVAASPGVGIGQVASDTAAALSAWEMGIDVVLVVDHTTPADEPAMRVATAIVTTGGGMSSHAAIIARQWGVPAVCGIGSLGVADGNRLLVDGATGEVRLLDDPPSVPAPSVASRGPLSALPTALATLLQWADTVARPKVVVMANADTATDAALALDLGAAGIGLCRTEHQFLGDHARLIDLHLNGNPDAAAEIGVVQRATLGALLDRVSPVPVTVRLLDAPIHEFSATVVEHNPMLGLRGVRLGVLHPELLVAQAEGIAHAIADAVTTGPGGEPIVPAVQVLVPMVALVDEMKWTRSVLADSFFRVGIERGLTLDVPIGTMIETPRAALIGSALATHSDFFSFGTNDLTQLTYGFSRDDLDHRLLREYRQNGFIARSPFETLDGSGVVRLMALAAETGRSQRPDLGLSMCGEHGGDPASIAIAVQLGLHSVSVSPYRVPATRLAAAHAVLGAG